MQKPTRPQKTEDTARREELVARVGREVRQQGAQSVVTSQIVAARFGLHTTDLECLDLIYLREQVTAGELAGATGLTTGAMTALLDRLERGGYVERLRDPADRRRVFVRINAEAIEPIKAVYLPMQKQMFALWSGYTEEQLTVIADFLSRSRELAVVCAADIQRGTPPDTRRRAARTSRAKAAGNS